MESINLVRGYGKVNPSEDETFQTPQKPIPNNDKKSNIGTTISIILIVCLFIGALIGLLVHQFAPDPPNQETQQASSSSTLRTNKTADLLKLVCNVTQQPELCFSTIWPICELLNPPKPDPVLFFNLSLQVAITQIMNLSSLPQTLIKEKNDPGTEAALKDCISLFDDSLSQFSNSLAEMEVGELTEMKISDMQTWMSAALTDQETCLDGLREMNSRLVGDVEGRVHDTKMYMDNSLAILNNLTWLIQKFGFTMN